VLSYSKTQINNRWDVIPSNLREVLYSQAYAETIIQIARTHHLNDRKAGITARLAGFVIYGFVHPEELGKKIKEEIDIDIKTADEIAEEIDRKIFSQFRKEIFKIYSPISEAVTQVEEIKRPEKEKIIFPLKSKYQEGKKKDLKKGAPFIIHRETGESAYPVRQAQGKEGKEKKDFDFSFGQFFGKEKQEGDKGTAKVEVPFFSREVQNKKEEEKTVHYSEYRTTPSYEGGESFINLPDTQKVKPLESKSEMPVTKIKESSEKNGGEKKKQEQELGKPDDKFKKKGSDGDGGNKGPSIEGNIIDLRNL